VNLEERVRDEEDREPNVILSIRNVDALLHPIQFRVPVGSIRMSLDDVCQTIDAPYAGPVQEAEQIQEAEPWDEAQVDAP
jgi:hypothetical protein